MHFEAGQLVYFYRKEITPVDMKPACTDQQGLLRLRNKGARNGARLLDQLCGVFMRQFSIGVPLNNLGWSPKRFVNRTKLVMVILVRCNTLPAQDTRPIIVTCHRILLILLIMLRFMMLNRPSTALAVIV